eukprot:COSAG02_NODE_19_length_53976_cov_37.338512_27_plen_140_part_00
MSWPLLEDQISRFHHNIKPYWLTPPLSKVKEHGLLAENAIWSAASNRLYLFCWKDKMEALRKTEKVSGNEWWLLQDFWTGANGILDTYYVSKHPRSELVSAVLLVSIRCVLLSQLYTCCFSFTCNLYETLRISRTRSAQ